ncbi:MAG: carboxy terminal-processing peptidase [Pseudomonadales bacterium]|jgi:carboxyl-terminal processing protease|nr:carboxy terminal-processing peptidase [Pseudomonadales bacterium]
MTKTALNKILLQTGAVALSALTALWFSTGPSAQAQAQAPIYLPADIPLEVTQIYKPLEADASYTRTTRDILDELRRNHYASIRVDDQFSATLLDSYIKTLDGARMYFTQADIAEFEKYRNQLDDLLLKGDTAAGYLMYNRYQERVIERLVYSINRVENDQTPFDFTVDESMILDRSEEPWPADHAALEDLWRQQVKSSVLSLKLTGKDVEEVRDLLSKRFRSQLSQVLKTNGLDVYQRYMDAMTMSFDPHTQYYAPRAAENFNMSMRLSLEGIGAVLTTKDEYTEVDSIVTGGPADLTGQLHPGDKLVGVAQGDQPFVDVIGWRVDDVVELVRGEKGSVVRLNVIPAGGSGLETKEIPITRDTVKLEDSSAKSEIVEVEYNGATHRIGIIELPTFYIDFEALQRRDPNYRSSTRDVHALLDKLKQEKVEAVIVDLRGNGGGSLSEANSLVGLFIRRGPTVQVRDADGNNIVQGDSDEEIVYDGPLAVLVNRLSASASEIFAGAIQDYQRGLVLGSQTFGKGTVQELIPLGDGQIKITRAKFYRISGESTQHKGVTPDVLFPDLFSTVDDIGESALPTALPWDTIQANYYRPYADLKTLVPGLESAHEARLANDPDFVFINDEIAKALEVRAQNTIPLNEEKLKAEREAEDAWRLQAENKRRAAKGEELLADIAALKAETGEDDEEAALNPVAEELAQDENSAETDAEKPDPYLLESGRVLLDLIGLQNSGAQSLVQRQAQ